MMRHLTTFLWGKIQLFLVIRMCCIYGVTPKPTLKIGPKQSRWGAVEELLVTLSCKKFNILQTTYGQSYNIGTIHLTAFLLPISLIIELYIHYLPAGDAEL